MGATNSKTGFISLETALSRFTYAEIQHLSNAFNLIKIQYDITTQTSQNSNFSLSTNTDQNNNRNKSQESNTSYEPNSSHSSSDTHAANANHQNLNTKHNNPSANTQHHHTQPQSAQYQDHSREIRQILVSQENFYISHISLHSEVFGSIFPIYISNKIYSLFASLNSKNEILSFKKEKFVVHSHQVIIDYNSSNPSSSHQSKNFNQNTKILDPSSGLYSYKKLSFSDLLCCLAVIFYGRPEELTKLAYFVCIDESLITNFETLQPLMLSKYSFEKSILLSEFNFNVLAENQNEDNLQETTSNFKHTSRNLAANRLSLQDIFDSFKTGKYLPAAAKSFFQNTSDIIDFDEYAKFIKCYPKCCKIFEFLSQGVGFDENCRETRTQY